MENISTVTDRLSPAKYESLQNINMFNVTKKSTI